MHVYPNPKPSWWSTNIPTNTLLPPHTSHLQGMLLHLVSIHGWNGLEISNNYACPPCLGWCCPHLPSTATSKVKVLLAFWVGGHHSTYLSPVLMFLSYHIVISLFLIICSGGISCVDRHFLHMYFAERTKLAKALHIRMIFPL